MKFSLKNFSANFTGTVDENNILRFHVTGAQIGESLQVYDYYTL